MRADRTPPPADPRLTHYVECGFGPPPDSLPSSNRAGMTRIVLAGVTFLVLSYVLALVAECAVMRIAEHRVAAEQVVAR